MIEWVVIVFLFAFLAFLLYQVILVLWTRVGGYSWWYGMHLYSIKTPDWTKSPYYGKHVDKRVDWLAYYPTLDDPVIKSVAVQLDYLAGMKKLNDTQKANMILKFVQQSIRYTKDSEQYGKNEYYQLPVNTLARKAGDCEDSAFLFVALAHHCRLDTIIVDMIGHITDAVNVSAFGKKYVLNNTKYYRAETTSAFIQYVGICLNQDAEIERLSKPEMPTDAFKNALKEE